MVEHLEDRAMNTLNLVTPAVVSSPARPPAPVRRTYGRKRILDPDLLDVRNIDMPLKKTKTHATPDLASKPQPVHTTLAALPVNNPQSTGLLLPGPMLVPTSSPIKHTPRWTRNDQDQNALDSPFLEPRRPLARPGLTRRASSRNPKPTIYSRHLSHSVSKKRGDPTKDELRRKTSEATTTVTISGDHSWLVPAPPRALGNTRYVSAGEAEFSFNPPAESTMAVARTPRGQIGHGINPGSVTPRANPVDMQPRRKRHDSILSTDSEDEGATLSVTAIMPLIPGPPLKPKRKSRSFHQLDLDDPDATPRAPSLLEQLRQPRPRSSSVTIRRLSVERADEGVDGDDEMDEKQAPRHDSAVRELTDACASMGKSRFPSLDEPSSPSDRLSKPATKRTGSKAVKPMSPMVARRVKRSAKPYQLSPRTVYRLSQRPRVDMRIEAHPLSPNEDSDMFATYDFDKGVRGFRDDPNDV